MTEAPEREALIAEAKRLRINFAMEADDNSPAYCLAKWAVEFAQRASVALQSPAPAGWKEWAREVVAEHGMEMAKAYKLGSPESRAIVSTVEHIRIKLATSPGAGLRERPDRIMTLEEFHVIEPYIRGHHAVYDYEGVPGNVGVWFSPQPPATAPISNAEPPLLETSFREWVRDAITARHALAVKAQNFGAANGLLMLSRDLGLEEPTGPAGDGWREIASAPRDTMLLVFHIQHGYRVAAWHTNSLGERCWPDFTSEPIRWRPLPAPPAPVLGDAGEGK